MWLNSKKAAEILGIKYGTLVKSINRASKKGKKFCSIKSNILNFKYIIGVGGNSGKTLQIWIDDANLSGGNTVGGDMVSSDIVDNDMVSSDMTGGDCIGDISLSNSQNLSLSESNASSTQLNLEPLDILNPNNRALNLDENKKAKHNEQTKNQKIKDLEKMNKIKAVNEMNAVPNGFGKTAWGKSIAQKYGVSLKTLYSWKKRS